MIEKMLSTKDNPYNPFTQPDEWFSYDSFHAHHSCELLGRIARCSYDLSDEMNTQIINDAVDSIVKNDPLHIYIAVEREVEEAEYLQLKM